MGLLLLLVPILAYLIHFIDQPLSASPGSWGLFGDFMGGVAGPSLALVNIGLFAYIAVELRRALDREETEKERTWRLFSFMREWDSEAMYNQRSAADALRQRWPRKDIKEISRHESIDGRALYVVIGFFQGLQFAVEREIVNEKDAVELFGRIFIWWKVVGIQGDYPPEWDRFRRIDKFYKLVKRVSDENQGKDDAWNLTDWENDARQYLIRYQEEHDTRQRLERERFKGLFFGPDRGATDSADSSPP